VNMRVNKVRLSEDTGIEACELGKEATGSASHVVSSVEETGGAVGLVFTFGLVWLHDNRCCWFAPGSLQSVTIEVVLDGWETFSCLHFSTY
jgi:hypothetical protein